MIIVVKDGVINSSISVLAAARVFAGEAENEDAVAEIVKNFRPKLQRELAVIEGVWGAESEISVREVALYDDNRFGAPQRSWAVVFARPSPKT
jgi:hypothetical protein